MRFTAEEEKFMADFYVENYEILAGCKSTAEINRQRFTLRQNLTKALNRHFEKDFTTRQVHDKLKNLRRDAKKKWNDMKKGHTRTGGGHTENSQQLKPAEEILVSKLGTTAGFSGLPVSVDASRKEPVEVRSHRRRPERVDQEESERTSRSPSSSIDSMLNESNRTTARPNDPMLGTGVNFGNDQLGGDSDNDVFRVGSQEGSVFLDCCQLSPNLSSSDTEAHAAPVQAVEQESSQQGRQVTKRKTAKNRSTALLRRDIFRLQKRVLLKQQKNEDVKATLFKKAEKTMTGIGNCCDALQNMAEEFREMVAEKRLSARGVDIASFPVSVSTSLAAAITHLQPPA